MNCCIPKCDTDTDPDDATCRMGDGEGFVLCYPHAAVLYADIEHLLEWADRAPAIEAWVRARGGMETPVQLRAQAARGFR